MPACHIYPQRAPHWQNTNFTIRLCVENSLNLCGIVSVLYLHKVPYLKARRVLGRKNGFQFLMNADLYSVLLDFCFYYDRADQNLTRREVGKRLGGGIRKSSCVWI